MASKIKGLQQWCQRMTDGYRDVYIKDFTTSWRNGLAFCAIIHRFRPDLIDYDSLSKENVFDNNNLAFTVAEKELDIPAFLEAADMVALKTPDKLSVITYVSQYYNKLSPLPQLGGPGVQGKVTSALPAHGTKRHQPSEPLSEPEPKKQPPAKKAQADDTTAKVKTLGDRCAICNNKVYLLERHVEEGKLYHRSCFRHSDLSPTNKVYTRSPFLSPSLHGKESGAAAAVKSKALPSEGKDSSRPKEENDKHGVKRPANDVGHTDAGKSEVRKFLFSRDTDAKNKPEESKSSTKDSRPGKKDVSADKHQPDHSALARNHASHSNSNVVSSSPAAGPTSRSHSSTDFLSAGKDVHDVKSPKRQLPLVFQAASSTNDGASDKTKSAAGDKTPLSKAKLESGSKSSDLSTKKPETSSNSVTPAKRFNDKSSHSESSSKSVCDYILTSKNSKQHVPSEKTASESKVSEKSSAPVAKPRHTGTKVLPSTSELNQKRDKSPSFPKASPRTRLYNTETPEKSKSDTTQSSSALRKSPNRLEPSAREPSPPPLPSSAPPPLPQSPPGASTPLSARHLPNPSSPQPTPRKHSTPVSAGQDTVSHSKYTASKANAKSSDNALSGTSSNSRPSENKGRNDLSALSSKAMGSGNQRHEEPMDVETAFSKARLQRGEEPVAVMVTPASTEQEDKTALTGLLKSLAQVRNVQSSASASSSTTITLSSSHTTAQNSHTTPGTSESSSSRFVSSKVSLWHSKDDDHKSVDKEKGKKSSSSLTDESVGESRSKSSISVLKTEDNSHKGASVSSGISSDKTLPVANLGETLTITLNTGKAKEDATKPVSILSKQKESEKPSDRVPLYKKKADSNLRNRTDRSCERETTVKDVTLRTKDAAAMKKERPKSAADILNRKELSIPKQPTASTDTAQPPLFAQLKLRETNFSTLERKERAKSVGNIFDSSTDSKPSWQQEAERKMAVFRDNGFVDPENKKALGKSAETLKTAGTGAVAGKHDKTEPPARPPPIHTPVSEIRRKEEKVSEIGRKEEKVSEIGRKEEKASQAKPAEEKKKSEDIKANTGNASKQDPSTSASGQPAASAAATNLDKKKAPFGGLLKGILKSDNKDVAEPTNLATPVRPERRSQRAKKQQAEDREAPAVTETPKIGDAAGSSEQAETGGTKKKITATGLKLDLDQSFKSSPTPSPVRSPPPARPPPPNLQGRKKISVDINFDFNRSNSMELSSQPSPQPAEKDTTPAKPPPLRRTSMSPGRLSAIELQQQLLEIDSKLSELELRGRHLEDSIRSVAAEEEDEDLMMEWFQLVTEKNDLVRKECDLVYMSREQDLEDEQSQIESQLHYLLSKEENDKSFEEKQEEEYLIERKVKIVDQRNTIVESIDEDRLRYEAEDRDIAQMLQVKGFRRDSFSPLSKEKDNKKVGSSKFYT